MKPTITTAYIPATDTRGSRIRATGHGRQVTIPYDSAAGSKTHDIAALALARLVNPDCRAVELTDESRSGRGYRYEIVPK